MSTKRDGETRTVFINLLILLLIFYATEYIACLICAAALGMDFNGVGFNAGMLPFNHWACGVGESNYGLVVWIGLIFGQLSILVSNIVIVRSTLHVWDYALTVPFIHFILTCIVTQACPSNWQWWVTTVVCTIIVTVASELVCYFFIDMQEIQKN